MFSLLSSCQPIALLNYTHGDLSLVERSVCIICILFSFDCSKFI
jgi:hypothetical protein